MTLTWSRKFLWLIAFAGFVRLAVALVTAISPIPNEAGIPASPFHVAPSSDLQVYRNSGDQLFNNGLRGVIDSVSELYEGDIDRHRGILAAPLLPAMLLLFNYEENNTWPLALFFVFLSIATAGLWLWWFEKCGLATVWLVSFALLPHFIWFMINLGSDLLAAFFFAGFFIVFKSLQGHVRRYLWSFFFVGLLLLTRPNGISVLIFVFASILLLDTNLSPRERIVLAIVFVLAYAPFLTFFLPYAVQFAVGSARLTYFGYTQAEYFSGVFGFSPQWLDLLASWFALIAAKLVYLVGFRPSFGGVDTIFLFTRAAPSLFFLPGLIYLMARGDREDKWLVLIFIVPILAGGAQDRYILPVQPILFFYGVAAYQDAWALIAARRADFSVRESAMALLLSKAFWWKRR